jgi:putative PIN family toxin of toxin-antitoxin system
VRVVLDSNVVVSAFPVGFGPSAQIVDAVRDGRLTWILSTVILDEVRKVLALPRIQRRFKVDPGAVALLVTLLGEKAVQVGGVVRVEGRSRDAKDHPILACAVEGGAEYVVTGDEDLLVLGTHEGISIVTPREFLEVLARL